METTRVLDAQTSAGAARMRFHVIFDQSVPSSQLSETANAVLGTIGADLGEARIIRLFALARSALVSGTPAAMNAVRRDARVKAVTPDEGVDLMIRPVAATF